MASFYIRVDEHTPMLIKALIKYGSYKQNYYASELGIKPSNLSAYLSGDKECPFRVEDGIRRILKVWESSENKINRLIGEQEDE